MTSLKQYFTFKIFFPNFSTVIHWKHTYTYVGIACMTPYMSVPWELCPYSANQDCIPYSFSRPATGRSEVELLERAFLCSSDPSHEGLKLYLGVWTDGCSCVRWGCSSCSGSLNSFKISWNTCCLAQTHMQLLPLWSWAHSSYSLFYLLTDRCLDSLPVLLAQRGCKPSTHRMDTEVVPQHISQIGEEEWTL